MATLDDILTTQKNGVVAINNLAQTLSSFYGVYASVTGKYTSNTVNAITSIFTGAGRLIGFTVVTAGSTAGTLYDALITNISTSTYTTTAVTLGYGSKSNQFSVGDTIIVSGMTPSGYNGTYTVTAIGSGTAPGSYTVTYANTTNAAITVYGLAFNGSLPYQKASVPSTAGFNTSNIIITNGLVYQPGTSQAANFTYSQ